MLPVLALATVYDPTVAPAAQNFEQGLSKFIATMMRLLLPLTLAVLAVYVLVIPFNFFAPFENRDVLIVYNVMLFAIIGLLMGATPIQGTGSPRAQKYLRLGILVVAGLTVLVSGYALAAVVYRTFQGELTPNRLTVIGWNSINIGILQLLITQLRQGREGWIRGCTPSSARRRTPLAWGLFLVIALHAAVLGWTGPRRVVGGDANTFAITRLVLSGLRRPGRTDHFCPATQNAPWPRLMLPRETAPRS